MKLMKVVAASVGAVAAIAFAQSGSALWRTAPTAAVNGGSMLLWTRSGETVQYAAGLPDAWKGASVNLTAGWPNGTRHRVRTQCTNGLFYTSASANGYTLYENVYYDCPFPYDAWQAWGQLDQ